MVLFNNHFIFDQTTKLSHSIFGGIKYYFSAPVFPRRTFLKLGSQLNSKYIFWYVLILHLVLVSLLDYLNPSSQQFHYRSFNWGIFVFGFILGIIGRTFLLAYIFWISINRIFRITVSYALCANIVLVTLLPLSSAVIMTYFGEDYYGIVRWAGMIYSSILITIAFTLIKQVDFSRMLALVIVTHFIYWLALMPFMGIVI